MKIKTLLGLGITTLLGISTFTNGANLSPTGTITLNNQTLEITNGTCNNTNCVCTLILGDWEESCTITSMPGIVDFDASECNLAFGEPKSGVITVMKGCNFDNLSYTLGQTQGGDDNGSTGGDDNGSTGGGSTGGTSGLMSGFNTIINRLWSIAGEFLPYIIYIAIACIGVSLLFRALKGLLGFTGNNAKRAIGGREGMKARRRWRRQQRRKVFTTSEVYKGNNDDYYKIGKGRWKKRTNQRWKRFGKRYSKTYRTKGYYSKN